MLLLADIVFILVDILISENYQSLLAIGRDLGYAEIYQYIKEFWITTLLFLLAISRRQFIYLAWSALYFYFLLDDSFQIHEKIGRIIVRYFELEPLFEIRAQTIGSLAVSVLTGLILFSAISISYFFSNVQGKSTSKYLFVLTVGVVFFGVFVDTIHAALPGTISFWSLVEDGGEMLAMSIVVAYVYNLNLKPTWTK